MKQLFVLVGFSIFMFSCADDEDITKEGGPITYYYVDNQTTRDLYIYSQFMTYDKVNDTLLLPQNTLTNFSEVGAFLNNGEPSFNLYNLILLGYDSKVYDTVYVQHPIVDSLWNLHDFDSIPEWGGEVHYSLTVVDSMLK